uniref:Atlastin 2 n=1 Tax=Rhipicephalus appendiculatus TaxID=34631 RepID=A0A131YG25_RHIAP
MNNIKEDDLQHLQFFAEYGRLALKENETRPFQKLLFLVRDWNWPVDFEFGSHGGRSLITSLLKITEKQAPELKTLRQSILSCFSDIDGFLLPYPGEKVFGSHALRAGLRGRVRRWRCRRYLRFKVWSSDAVSRWCLWRVSRFVSYCCITSSLRAMTVTLRTVTAVVTALLRGWLPASIVVGVPARLRKTQRSP